MFEKTSINNDRISILCELKNCFKNFSNHFIKMLQAEYWLLCSLVKVVFYYFKNDHCNERFLSPNFAGHFEE